MGRAALCMRAVALLTAAGMFIFLAEGISADNEIAEAVAARVLEPTEVVAEVPEEYNTLFELQWGGGSLYQLKGRLATMGCMANTIWLYDNDKWNIYNQYNISHDNFIIQQFLNTYSEFIPAGTLWADCYDLCEIKEISCPSLEEMNKDDSYYFITSILNNFPCTDNFDPRIKQYTLPRLPHRSNACIVRYARERYNVSGIAFAGAIPHPIIVVYKPTRFNNDEYLATKSLAVEMHELCHIAQDWQWAQGLSALRENKNSRYFDTSEYGKEFINLVGFTQTNSGKWRLPVGSIYRRIYSFNPVELSAELCAMYLLDAIGEPSSYIFETYIGGFYTRLPQRRDFDTSKYLTPEVVEWLETYMILPDVSE